MSYFPFFRGKQYELITVRECAHLLSDSGFVPIVEPVKESLRGLQRTVDAVSDAGGSVIIIANPQNGFYSNEPTAIERFLIEEMEDRDNVEVGLMLGFDTTINEVLERCEAYRDRSISLIHCGFSDARTLVETLGNSVNQMKQVFWDGKSSKLYQRRFQGATKILLRDGFEVRTNRNHPPIESFSDLHITYEQEGVDGFGDFLVVGANYSDTGGPAYAVAIHITFINHERDDEMFIHHFVSDRQNTPTDPAGKFLEALNKLVTEVESPGTSIYRGQAIDEFMELHEREHYPGLGYIKKLSMKHHLETLADYFARE